MVYRTTSLTLRLFLCVLFYFSSVSLLNADPNEPAAGDSCEKATQGESSTEKPIAKPKRHAVAASVPMHESAAAMRGMSGVDQFAGRTTESANNTGSAHRMAWHVDNEHIDTHGAALTTAQKFKYLANDRTLEGCQCDPTLAERVWGNAYDLIVSTLRRLFNRSVDRSANLKAQMSKTLRKTGADPESFERAIDQINANFINALVRSFKSDLSYYRVYWRIHSAIKGAGVLNAESAIIYKTFMQLNDLIARNIDVKDTLSAFDNGEMTVDGSQEMADMFHRAVVNAKKLEELVEEKQDELNRLVTKRQRKNGYIANAIETVREYTGIKVAETEKPKPKQIELSDAHDGLLADLLSDLASVRHESQRALSEFIIRSDEFRILMEFRNGDSSGMSGSFKPRVYRKLLKTLDANKHFLNGVAGFEDLYARMVDAPSSRQVALVWELSNLWEDQWAARIEKLEPRIDFYYATTSVGTNLARVAAGSQLGKNDKAMQKIRDSVAASLDKYHQWEDAMDGLARSEANADSNAADLKAAQTAGLIASGVPKAEFDALVEFVRINEEFKPTDRVTVDRVRDLISRLSSYVTKRSESNQFHPVVLGMFDGAKGTDILEFMRFQRTVYPNGKLYDLPLMQAIYFTNISGLERYRKNGSKIFARRLIGWLSMAGAVAAISATVAHLGFDSFDGTAVESWFQDTKAWFDSM